MKDGGTALKRDPMSVSERTRWPILFGVTILTGIGAGLGGMALALLLHAIQHIAYGYSLDATISPETFLQGRQRRRTAAPDPGPGSMRSHRWHRLVACLSFRPSPRQRRQSSQGGRSAHADPDDDGACAAADRHRRARLAARREVAPREIGATFAGWLSHYAGLTPAESRLMVACGRGGPASPLSIMSRSAALSLSLKF